MAKQKGLHKLAGKVDEQSYYYSKNGGYQSRKINPGIGERVKTAQEYFNTRLNNAEFGAAGACAGAMVREVSQRWRYILNSIATGLLVKQIKALMEQDNTSPWGQRVVPPTDMPSVQDAYTRFSKNQMPEAIANYFKQISFYYAGGQTVEVGGDDATPLQCGDELSSFLDSIGATGCTISIYSLAVKSPEFSTLNHRYLPIASSMESLVSVTTTSVNASSNIFPASSTVTRIPPINSNSMFGGLFVLFEPIRTIGSTNFVLQQHCSGMWFSMRQATPK